MQLIGRSGGQRLKGAGGGGIGQTTLLARAIFLCQTNIFPAHTGLYHVVSLLLVSFFVCFLAFDHHLSTMLLCGIYLKASSLQKKKLQNKTNEPPGTPTINKYEAVLVIDARTRTWARARRRIRRRVVPSFVSAGNHDNDIASVQQEAAFCRRHCAIWGSCARRRPFAQH